MHQLYYIIESDGRSYWVPWTIGKDHIKQFEDAQDAAAEAEKIPLAKDFEIRSDTHERTMRGIRFGNEIIWRLNGTKKPIQYRGNVDRFA